MHPAGLSNEQLLWRLRNAGIRFSTDDLLQSLGLLMENGEIAMAEPGHWRVAAFMQGKSKPTSPDGRSGTRPTFGALLRAVLAKPEKPFQPRGTPAPLENLEGAPANFDWKALLRYYAVTQRQDPRGRVDERADRSCPKAWCSSRAAEQVWLLGQAARGGRLTARSSLSGAMVSRLM